MTDLPPQETNPNKVYWLKNKKGNSKTHLTLNNKRTICGYSFPNDAIFEKGPSRLCSHCQDKWVKMWYFNYTEQEYERWQPLFCQMGGGLDDIKLTAREKHEFPNIVAELEKMQEVINKGKK